MEVWNTLKSRHDAIADRPLLALFEDAMRPQDFSVETAHMRFDYSKTNIDRDTRADLIHLAEAAGVAEKRDAMFRGDKINDTEGRAVLHTALRDGDGEPVVVDGQDVLPGVRATLYRMKQYAEEIRASGITDVVNIGIGGSDLGPAMAVAAPATGVEREP